MWRLNPRLLNAESSGMPGFERRRCREGVVDAGGQALNTCSEIEKKLKKELKFS